MQKTLQHFLEPDDVSVSRMEVLEGPTGRRRWSDELKAQMVAETFVPGARVCEVARRHGIAPQYLTTLRTLARKGLLAGGTDSAGGFASVEVERPSARPLQRAQASGIEVETAGVLVRLPLDVSSVRLGEIVAMLRRPA